DIKIAGDLAVVGVQDFESSFGLLILDISDPANPVELSRFDQESWQGVHNLFLHGDRLYLAHGLNPGLSIVDISDPTAPLVSGFWQHEGDFSNVVHDVFIRDHLAVVSDLFSGLVLLDLTDPDTPTMLAALPLAEGIHSAWAEGDYVYCNQEFGGWKQRLYVVDIADPRQPQVVHSFGSDPPPQGPILGPHNPWVHNGLLYWAYYEAGLRVFDLLDPARPVEIGYHTYPGFAWSVQPHDDGLLYVADGAVGIEAFRLNEPAFAIRAVAVDPPVAIRGRHRSVDIEATVAPSPRRATGHIAQVGIRLNDETTVQPLHAEGRTFTGSLPLPPDLPTGRHRLHAELIDDRGHIYPYNLPYDLYPERDLEIYSETLAEGWSLERGETAFFAGRQALILPGNFDAVFEARTPFDLTGYTALRFAFHPDAVEDFSAKTLETLAVSIGVRTVQLGFGGGDSLAVDLADKRWQTVEIPLSTLGVSDADLPFKIDSVRIFGYLKKVAYIADLALVAATPPIDTAVHEEQANARPAAFNLAQNFPNPFNQSTVIRIDLETRAEMELAVYNLAGQKVATLAQGPYPSGAYTFTWDGRNTHGAELASGVYCYRLKANGREQTRKLILLR
ncbi:MAG: T9SS type A sorting domain-containing protein, partial [Gemmatimonadetes bacterium]|nr:T9SS type A sorting domain-containing protein [Gemmatimonadota bacterium]